MSPNPDPNKPIGLRDLKHHPKGASKLGYDGVLRSFDGEGNIFDAIGLSPFQLKYFLDRHNEWSQETEDRYRGVDGTKVTDHEALYNPPDEMRLPKVTEEEKAATRKMIEEHNRKLLERIEQERKEGVNVEEKYACTAGVKVIADFNLEPKNKENGVEH